LGCPNPTKTQNFEIAPTQPNPNDKKKLPQRQPNPNDKKKICPNANAVLAFFHNPA
jgi:hypothetical protein